MTQTKQKSQTEKSDTPFLGDKYIRVSVRWFIEFFEANDACDNITVQIENERVAKGAIRLLLRSASLETRAWAIKQLLAVYYKYNRKNKLFRTHDYLNMICAEMRLGISKEVVELVIHEVVQRGWYGCAEDMICKYAQRIPTEEEIMTLVDVYVNDFGSSCTETQRILISLGQRYLSQKKVSEIQEKIGAFDKQFNDDIF